jgi:multiple antibiotic resistance protein
MIKDYKYVAVFPLAIPSIASPGAIMAVVLLTDNIVYTLPQQAFTTLLVLLVVFLQALFCRQPEKFKNLLASQASP